MNPHGAQPSIYDAENDVTYFDLDVADRVPHMIRTLAYVWSGFVVIGVALITRRDQNATSE